LEELYEQAAKTLDTIHFATLATVTPEGRPWNTPVMMLHDNVPALYWYSHSASTHSQNIAASPRVFIVIFDSTVELGPKLDRAVYIEAACSRLIEHDKIKHASDLLRQSVPSSPYDPLQVSEIHAYEAIPDRNWTNTIKKDNGRFTQDTRIELEIGRLGEYLLRL
jgi:pyridoxine/pyridoxamine 5'-phosphate oxidase